MPVCRKRCEICGIFKPVGFTDCGLICEQCFQKEVQIEIYNSALEDAAKIADRADCENCAFEGGGQVRESDIDYPKIAEAIRSIKKLTHKKDRKILMDNGGALEKKGG